MSMFAQAKTLFDEAALDIEEQLIQTSASGLTYIAEMKYETNDIFDMNLSSVQ